MQYIKCSGCQWIKAAEFFGFNKSRANGYAAECKDCRSMRKSKHAWKDRLWKIRSTYNLSLVQLLSLFRDQECKCQICKKPIDLFTACIDHNHSTNVVRGLLDNNCNCGIGMLQEDRILLQNASVYLDVQ